VISFAFDFSVLEIFLPLVTGARLVIAGDEAGDGARLARRLADGEITWMSATPTTWRMLLEGGWRGSPGLTACAGGEPLTPELARQLLPRTAAVWNLYGPTETTVFSTLAAVTDPGPITIGRPIANTQVYVLDDRMRPQPAGVAGEICIGGAGVADGYAGRPALTADRFVPDDLGPLPGRRLYRTGDIGRWLADGRLECLGRRDGQVKLRGYRIETGEVATVLEQCPGVSRAAVLLRPDRVGDPQLAAYVTAVPGAGRPTAGQLREHAARRLPRYMVPTAFAILDALPATPNGKLDTGALPDLGHFAAAGERDGAEPALTRQRTPTEQRVAAAWMAVLGIDALDVDDDFFDLGGESMKAVRVVRRIDPQLPVLDLFTYPTVRSLAAHLDSMARSVPPAASGAAGSGTTARPLIVRLPTSGPAKGAARTMLVCVPFGGGSAVSFEPLARHAPDGWDVRAVELPGHDYARRAEPLLPLPEVARRCAAEIADANPAEVVLYGHCVGSALAVAIAAELEAGGRTVRGVVAGASFPAARLPGVLGRLTRLSPTARQNARAVQDSLRVLGGLGEALPPAERQLLARNLRHDAHQAEDFFAGPMARLAAPLLAVTGGADRLTDFAAERVHDWEAVAGDVRLAVLAGAEHFFIRERPAELMRLLADWLDGGAGPAVPGAEGPGAAVPVPASRMGAFLLVAAGQLVSLIGTGLSTFALGVWAYQRTGSVTAFAGITTVSLLPAIAAAPLAGAAADRLDRRRVMLACDATGLLAALLVIGLLATGSLRLPELYAIAAVSATAGAFRQPAYLAGATQLVPKRYLGSASGLLQLGTASGTIVAQLLGGAIVTLAGLRGAAAIDALTFLVALATLLAVRFPDALFARRPEPLGREIAAGARFVLDRPPLVALTLFFTGANALGGLVVVLTTPLVLSVSSPAVLGSVLAMQGAGMLAGGTLMTLWGGARKRSLGMLAAVAIFGLSALLIGAVPRPAAVAVGMAGVGVCAALASAHWLCLVQVKVPVPMQGRVLSSCLMLARAMMPLAYLIAGPLASAAGTGVRGIALVMAVTGLLALAWTAAGYLFRPLRLADDLLPDALLDMDTAGPGRKPAGAHSRVAAAASHDDHRAAAHLGGTTC
jgi:surfactin synthase thioesterase subunit